MEMSLYFVQYYRRHVLQINIFDYPKRLQNVFFYSDALPNVVIHYTKHVK